MACMIIRCRSHVQLAQRLYPLVSLIWSKGSSEKKQVRRTSSSNDNCIIPVKKRLKICRKRRVLINLNLIGLMQCMPPQDLFRFLYCIKEPCAHIFMFTFLCRSMTQHTATKWLMWTQHRYTHTVTNSTHRKVELNMLYCWGNSSKLCYKQNRNKNT